MLDPSVEVSSLLIAETDPAVLHTLPPFLSSRLPQLDIHVATSTYEAHRKMSKVRYAASIFAPSLIGETGSLRLHRIENNSVLMPVILTAAKTDVDTAREALLRRGAFDVITKPIQPTEAFSSVRLALWETRLLRLLMQRERALKRIERHLEEYPHETETRAAMEQVVEYLEATLTSARKSMLLMDPASDQLYFDLAVSIEERTKNRALDRLNRLIASAG